jgi:hypothetical protein
MRALSVLCSAGAIFALALPVYAATNQGTDDLPKRAPFDRYASMMKQSPFAVASAPAAPVATPNFAKDLYVANTARASDSDLVTVQSSVDRNMKEYLTTKGPNEHGYAISSIEWSDKPGQTKVTISKDGQFATLSYNQALISSMPNQQPAPMPGGMPNQPAAQVPVPTYVPPRPPNVPGMVPTPQPHQRGLIQRNPSVPQPPPQAQQQKPVQEPAEQ